MTWEQLSLLDGTDGPEGEAGGPSPLVLPCCPDCGEPLSTCGDCGAPVCFGCRTGERLPGCALPRCDACLDFYDEGASPEGLDALLSDESFAAWLGQNK